MPKCGESGKARVQFSAPLFVFLLALALRLIPVLYTHDWSVGLDDMLQYDGLARSIVAGNGYRWYAERDLAQVRRYVSTEKPADYDPRGVLTSFRAPGYPAFLALIYWVSGVGDRRFLAAQLAQALLGATLAPLSWTLARQIGYGPRIARWAAIIIAVFPLLIVYPLALASENLFVPLLIPALILTLRAVERERPHGYLVAGFVLGLAALTRSIVAGFMPVAGTWIWWTAREKRTGLRNAVLLGLGFLTVTMPWAVRNTLLHGQLTWIETSLGYNLYIGYHPQSTGTFQYGISLDLLPILDDAERNTRGIEAFWAFVRGDPWRVPYLMIRKAGHLWGLDSRALIYFYANHLLGQWPAWLLGLVFLIICGPLVVMLPTAVAGMVCGPLGKRKLLVVALLATYTGMHMLIMAEARFHVPLLPIMGILAAYGLIERPWRSSRPVQRWLAALLIGLCFANWALEIARDWDTLVALFGPKGHRLYLPY
jgi:4-amino-4-deoxy-L-arabinose transferase-like glycosyltransferase